MPRNQEYYNFRGVHQTYNQSTCLQPHHNHSHAYTSHQPKHYNPINPPLSSAHRPHLHTTGRPCSSTSPSFRCRSSRRPRIIKARRPDRAWKRHLGADTGELATRGSTISVVDGDCSGGGNAGGCLRCSVDGDGRNKIAVVEPCPGEGVVAEVDAVGGHDNGCGEGDGG